jgi:uncharacterized membrane protein YkoI
MKAHLLTAAFLASTAIFAAEIKQPQMQDAKTDSAASCKECVKVKTEKCSVAAKKQNCKVAKKKYIGKKAAIGTALSHANLERKAVKDLKCEIDDENGIMVYEVEFESNGYDYEYDIDAISGKILKSKKELD